MMAGLPPGHGTVHHGENLPFDPQARVRATTAAPHHGNLFSRAAGETVPCTRDRCVSATVHLRDMHGRLHTLTSFLNWPSSCISFNATSCHTQPRNQREMRYMIRMVCYLCLAPGGVLGLQYATGVGAVNREPPCKEHGDVNDKGIGEIEQSSPCRST